MHPGGCDERMGLFQDSLDIAFDGIDSVISRISSTIKILKTIVTSIIQQETYPMSCSDPKRSHGNILEFYC
jgi:hypothetical protein